MDAIAAGYRIHPVPADLRGPVLALFSFEAGADLGLVHEYVVPEPACDLILQLGSAYFRDQDWVSTSQLEMMRDRPLRFVHGAGSRFVGARLAAWGPAAFGLGANAGVNGAVELQQLVSEVTALEERVSSAHPCAAVEQLSDWLRVRRRTLPHLPGVRRGLALLDDGASVGAAADTLGLSTRTLERRFSATLGRKPQWMSRLLRFRRTLAELDGVRDATALGYCDQAHLCREFLRWSGEPVEAHRRRRQHGLSHRSKLGSAGGSMLDAWPNHAASVSP